MKVFLDDCRKIILPGWITIRTAPALLDFMRWNKGKITDLTLDHDLMDTDPDEKHGYWFVKRMVDEGLFADRIFFHTANPTGRDNMYYYLMNAQEHGVIPTHVIIHHYLILDSILDGNKEKDEEHES